MERSEKIYGEKGQECVGEGEPGEQVYEATPGGRKDYSQVFQR